MSKLLEYPVFYCVAGILVGLFPAMRTTLWGLGVLVWFISVYGWLGKAASTRSQDPADIHEVGDNCYFIGFVYTLVVIAWALFFDVGELLDSESQEQLLTTVGIALGTSVAGMLWRFGLTHNQKPPEDQFDRAVQEVSKAANRLAAVVGDLEPGFDKAAKSLGAYVTTVEEEVKRAGESMGGLLTKLLTDISKQLVDTLKETHFADLQKAMRNDLASHQATITQVNEATAKSLEDLGTALATTLARVNSMNASLAFLHDEALQGKLKALTEALAALPNQIHGLGDALDRTLKTQTESLAGAEQELENLQELRGAFGELTRSLNDDARLLSEARENFRNQLSQVGQVATEDVERLRAAHADFQALVRDIHSDKQSIVQAKEGYRDAFDDAAQAALEETHKLYAKLILGATVALGGIENLGQLAKDLRTIAEDLERKGAGQ